MKILLPFALLIAFVSATLVPPPAAAAPPLNVDRLFQSLVRITYETPAGETGFCTGFVVDAGNRVATAEHCLQDKIWVDGLPAYVVKKDGWVVLLGGLEPGTKPPLQLAKNKPRILDKVYALGNAFDWGYIVLEASVAGWYRLGDVNHQDLAINSPLGPGMSGGPIVNEAGEVVAINQMATNATGIGCEVETLRKLMK